MTRTFYAAILALVPLVVGPAELPSTSVSISAKLCSGGTIDIPIKRRERPVPSCPEKACHAGSCRRRFDLAQ
ncbi:MAG: hypothetical protein CL574_00375 [Altererythrobacter sp.]|nr:hypothetical protein [Altererythrobacter sp.]